MLKLQQLLQLVEHCLWVAAAKFLFGERVERSVVRTVLYITNQTVEILLLILFSILAGFHHKVDILVVAVFIAFGIQENIFQQRQCSGHILSQSSKRNTGAVRTHTDTIVACQFVEFLLQLADRLLVGSDIFEITWSELKTFDVFCSEVVTEHQCEESVLSVLLVEQWQTFLGLAHREVFLEIEETRLNRCHMRILDFIQEGTRHVAIGRYRSNLWFLDFLLCVVCTDFLIDAYIVVVEIAIGEIDNVLLRQFFCTLELRSNVSPVALADKCVNHFCYAIAVALQATEIIEFHVVDHRWKQVVAEFAPFELFKFLKNQCTEFFKGLTLFRTSRDEEH